MTISAGILISIVIVLAFVCRLAFMVAGVHEQRANYVVIFLLIGIATASYLLWFVGAIRVTA